MEAKRGKCCEKCGLTCGFDRARPSLAAARSPSAIRLPRVRGVGCTFCPQAMGHSRMDWQSVRLGEGRVDELTIHPPGAEGVQDKKV